jgi:3-oxoadipate CoA-transferase alpha subunit
MKPLPVRGEGMKNKVVGSFQDAVSDISNGSSILMYSWGAAGTPQNLIRALRDSGMKDLTVITHNFIPAWIGAHVCSEDEIMTPFFLMKQVKKLITSWPRPIEAASDMFQEVSKEMERIELEVMSHGVLAERIRAGGSGIGGFYSPTGVGTVLEKGKEKRIIEGKEYLFEKPIRADFSFIKAYKADRRGNLVYRGAERGANPYMAMAGETTIVEVDEIVEVGELDPEHVVTPGIFVDRIVKIPDGALGTDRQRKEICRKYLMEES